MKIITFDDVVALHISPLKYYYWVSEIIKNKPKAVLPPKISMKYSQEGIFCNVMPCVIPAEFSPLGCSLGGVKIVTRYPSRVPSLNSQIILFNADTGENLALMDANIITAMRTGAVAAHSVKLFARKDSSTIGIMGLGNTARAFLLVLNELEPEREFKIKLLKYKLQEESFSRRFESYTRFHFEYVNTPEEIIRGSDVVISAVTYAQSDFCSDECFGEGVLVVPVHTLGFTNCDLFFDKVFADDYGHVKHFRNFGKFRSFSEVSEVVNGKSEGRKNDSERILVYNIGIALHDINAAANIFRLYMSSGRICCDFDMHEPESKFWI